MGSLEVFYEFLTMKTPCPAEESIKIDKKIRPGNLLENTGDTKSNTEHIVTRAMFTAALRCNAV